MPASDRGAGRPSAVFLNRFYWPDVAATGQMLTDLAEGLASRGWRVTVITGSAPYDGGAPTTPAPKREHRNGVDVIRVRSTRFGRGGVLGRLGDYASYVAGAARHVLTGARHDLIVAMSDPPMLAALAVAAARLRGARSVYWVQDLFPQVAGRLGVLREDGAMYRMLERIARDIHRGCDLVIALGPAMQRAVVSAGARPDRTTFVHNWSDTRQIRPLAAAENPFRRRYGLDGKFVVLYSGNAGRAHTFDAVLDAAARLRDNAEIVFLFIGGGQRIPELRLHVERAGLPNVRFLGYVPRAELPLSLCAADASLVTEAESISGLLVPSKAYGVLASGRPLAFVGSAESDVARIVRQSECGVVLSPGDGSGLAAWIAGLAANPAEAARLGANARSAAERNFDTRVAVDRWATAAETLFNHSVRRDLPLEA